MRLIFAGTPEVAVPTLRALAAAYEIVAVITRPDAPLGRKRVLTPSPVAVAAEELGISVIRAARLDDDVTMMVQNYEADLGVIVAYGGLVREPLLSTPRWGWINLHFSSLPDWRGAAPVQRAIMAGETSLGMSVFQLVAELDAGDVFAQREVNVGGDATADQAFAILAHDGAELVKNVVAAIGDGSAQATPQEGEPRYAAKLALSDGVIDWTQSASSVYARFRGVTTEPGASTTVHGERLKIIEMQSYDGPENAAPGEVIADKQTVLVGTGTSPIRLVRVQPAGRGAMAAGDWWRGRRDTARLGE
ncbi:methionyl-tRNA formyltransferase [Microbacterium sp. YY-01]|uniref:methionyl-tRNA formyltransferase n=1 Tax=Microbacterium sp. YY-01 TaxID=3421634 RepID=UPI003D16668C